VHLVRDRCDDFAEDPGALGNRNDHAVRKIAEHYKVEAVVKLEKYRAVKMQEALVKMQQEEEKLGMLQ